MFAQVISGRTSDPQAVRAAVDRWMRELEPGAVGWLGTTLGVADDGRFITVVRFDSAEAATANSQRPEQGRWWDDTKRLFDGEVTFLDSETVEVDVIGDPDRAGFVQVMHGQVSDPARAEELRAQLSTQDMAAFRPEILGSVMIVHDPDRWTQVLYFTSEAEARVGERKEPPAAVQAVLQELMSISPTPPEFIDLRAPLLQSPRHAGVPGPRTTAEVAEPAERTP